jgi:hypothetical protein
LVSAAPAAETEEETAAGGLWPIRGRSEGEDQKRNGLKVRQVYADDQSLRKFVYDFFVTEQRCY